MKYLVMECHPGYVVLLDEEGCFVKAANFHYQVGETVEDPVLMKEPVPARKRMSRGVMGLAAAAACFLLVFNSYYQNYLCTDTSIYLTINPSVCMELNRKGDVVRLSGANEDGEELLEDYQRSSNDRLEVVDELIDRAIEMGYLSEGGLVTIDIDAPDEVQFQKYGVELRTNLTEYLENQLVVEIQIVDHGAKIMEAETEEATSDSTKETVQEQKSTEPAATIPIEPTKPEQPQQTAPSGTPSGENTQTPAGEPTNPGTSSQTPARASQAPAASSDRKEEEETDYGTDYEVPEPEKESEDDGTDYDPDPGTDYESRDEEPEEASTDYGSDYDSKDEKSDEDSDEDSDQDSDEDSDEGSDYESSDYK